MTLNYVTLICDEGAGQGYFRPGGTATLTPSAVLTDATDHLIVDQSPVTVTFSTTGPPSARLLPTDNAALLPAGWGWTFTPPAGSGMTPFTFFLNFANGATQYLSAQVPVATAVAMQGYLPLPTGTPAPGQVPVATGTGEGSAWGNVLSSPMTTPGDMIYESAVPAAARLAGDTSNIRKFLRTQAISGVAQAPAWDTIQASDVPVLNQNTAGTAANVTATLDLIPAPAGNVAFSSHKGTGVANGTAATDVAAFGQIPASAGSIGGLLAASNLSDVANAGTSRTNLGLGSAAVLAAAAVAQTASNLSDLASASTARTNLGLGGAAVIAVPVTIANGGSGQSTQQAAINALTGTQSAGKLLRSDGTNATLAAILAADLPAATTSTQGAVILDGTATDIQADGATGAGATGKSADAGHIHPALTWIPSDNGLLVASADPLLTASNTITVAGTVYLIKLTIRTAMTISTLWWVNAVAGSGASTGSFSGLISSAGTLLTGSADIGAAFTTTGAKPVTMTTPQALAAGVSVWAVIVFNLATTQPTLARLAATATATNVNLAAASFRAATNGTGQTSLPASITPSANANGISYWAGGS
jgi:hypothetical protein